MVNSESSMTQLQALIRNGYARPANHLIPRLSKSAINLQRHGQIQQQQQYPQQQQQQQQQINQHFQSLSSNNFRISSSLAYTLQNTSLIDGHHQQLENSMITAINQQKSAGSDSSSSIGSSGDISPPETPSLIGNSSGTGSLKQNEQQHKQQKHQASQKQQQQLNYNKHINIARVNGRSDKLLPISVGANTSSTTLIYPQATSPQQHYLGNDITLSSGPNMIQSSLTNNNQVGGPGNDGVGSAVVCSVGTSANNNLGLNTVLITSPSAINHSGGSLINNVITSNSVILQPAQHQQYTAAHPYHVQHITSTTRPPIIPHNHGITESSPHGPFRLPSFQIPPNGELIYPYHPAGIAFLSGTAPPSTAVAAVRSSPTTSVPPSTTTNVTQLPQPLPPQQQSVLPSVQTNPSTSTALLTTTPYTSLTVGVSKQLSCYNCGSQTHNGRDCNEASMEDVTRGAVYKLDYSVSTSVSPTGPPTSGETLTGNNTNCMSCTQQPMTTIEMGAESTSPTASTSSSSSLLTSNVNPK